MSNVTLYCYWDQTELKETLKKCVLSEIALKKLSDFWRQVKM